MNDSTLIERAKSFATSYHQRINHRRKYTGQPYEMHLKSVAQLVAEVTDRQELVAAAWLHDVVEDTPATHYEIEQAFGKQVAQLVREVTDVSRPGDGNRAQRKAIDRDHLSQASNDGQTVKLADIIDNTRDICKHDPDFARVYLNEAQALLQVLERGDQELLRRARKAIAKCAERLGVQAPTGSMLDAFQPGPPRLGSAGPNRLGRLFGEAIMVEDIAVPLPSFDGARDAGQVAEAMREQGIDMAGIRHRGLVSGYVWLNDLQQGSAGGCARAFHADQLVDGDASLSDAVRVLSRHQHCLVRMLGHVNGLVTRFQLESPVARMWLFGMITILEMNLTRRIRANLEPHDWRQRTPDARLRKAEQLLDERLRRNQQCDLLDCLQLADKAQILISVPAFLQQSRLRSREAAKKFVKGLESLRNHLAHSQPFIQYDWPTVIILVDYLEQILHNAENQAPPPVGARDQA
jgi:hypothetical protein